MIIRDLTLRSAASFGSFHLIRLLFDEYMFYLVEQRVAQELQQSPVSVMAMNQFKSKKSEYEDVDYYSWSLFSAGPCITTAASIVEEEDEIDEDLEASPSRAKQAKINGTVSYCL